MVKQSRKVKKLFSELRPCITFRDLIVAKMDGFEVRKHSPFGLSPKEVGRVYCVEGYSFLVLMDINKYFGLSEDKIIEERLKIKVTKRRCGEK